MSTATLAPLAINKRTLARLSDPAAYREPNVANGNKDGVIMAGTNDTKYPCCDPSSFCGCGCGC